MLENSLFFQKKLWFDFFYFTFKNKKTTQLFSQLFFVLFYLKLGKRIRSRWGSLGASGYISRILFPPLFLLFLLSAIRCLGLKFSPQTQTFSHSPTLLLSPTHLLTLSQQKNKQEKTHTNRTYTDKGLRIKTVIDPVDEWYIISSLISSHNLGNASSSRSIQK